MRTLLLLMEHVLMMNRLDLETEKITQLGSHDKTISTMSFARQPSAS